MLSLDHRHLMEFTQHVLPTDERFVVYPSYASGNYAFMFDDEGWKICHPKFYNIRGILPDGTEFDPAPIVRPRTTSRGGGSIQPGLRRLHQSKLSLHCERSRVGRSGVIRTSNVDGTPRVVAYAPISYFRTLHNKQGMFGGITIGVE